MTALGYDYEQIAKLIAERDNLRSALELAIIELKAYSYHADLVAALEQVVRGNYA